MSDVARWLEELGLGQYAEVFAENAIDVEVLPHLSDNDLKELGLPLGHRRKLQAAIQALGDPQPTIAKAAPSAPASDASPLGKAEHRQLTVMFCDLVGSTSLSQRLGPEDLREVIGACQDAWKAAIERYEGFVARYMGDGILAYFGYPQAHEDDAERSVRAGLDAIQSMDKLNAGVGTEKGAVLAVRVGIATGPVVVGDLVGEGASQESAVIGEIPNLAARLQGLAEPNTVVIAPGTHRLTGRRFECTDLGERDLKGVAEPVRAWRVMGDSMAESRFEALRRASLTPLVGRDQELGLLLDRWEQAKEGDGQVVLLSGEAGIGKSRIAQTLHERAGEPGRLLYQCSPHHTSSALHPIIEQLERAAGFNPEDSAKSRLGKLEALFARSTRNVEAAVPLFADLLSIPTGDRYAALEMTPELQKEKTLEFMVAQVEGLSRAEPVFLVFEDVHWADPTSLELLEMLVEQVQRMAALVLITFRPDFPSPWTAHTHVTALTLNRFNRTLAAAMVSKVTGEESLPGAVVEQIVIKTDGNPLFVEELTRSVMESELLEEDDRQQRSGVEPWTTIPATLYDSLMARLDRAPAVKEVAQYASVIGREFSHEVLAAISPLGESPLAGALDQLLDAGLVFRRGTPPRAIYSFKHALVRDAAYDSLLRRKRRRMHGSVAQSLEGQFPEIATMQPELLAYHYAEAGRSDKAIDYSLQAGRRAAERSAHKEATEHLTKGLELLETQPDTPERAEQELRLRIALGVSVQAITGAGSPEVGRIYLRARELCGHTGEASDDFAVLWGLWRYYRQGIDFQRARELADELLSLAQRQPDSALLLQAHHAQWTTSYYRGEFLIAQQRTLRGVSLYDSGKHHVQATRFGGHDPCVCGHGIAACALWALGYPDQALERINDSLDHARKLDHPVSLGLALGEAAQIHQLRGETQAAQQKSEMLLALATELDFAEYRQTAAFLQGWAWSQRGQREAGVKQMRDTRADNRDAGAEIAEPYFVSLEAATYGGQGEVEEGLRMLDDILALTSSSGMPYWDAELLRVKGRLLLTLVERNEAEAEACFHQAVKIARDQSAKSLELRALMTLSRLWRDQGKHVEARDLLAPAYGWFNEGFDTADLKEAKAMLDELV